MEVGGGAVRDEFGAGKKEDDGDGEEKDDPKDQPGEGGTVVDPELFRFHD